MIVTPTGTVAETVAVPFAAEQPGKPLRRREAVEWTQAMQNADGTTGPHWPMEQVEQLLQQRGLEYDPPTFFAVLNSVYSDYSEVAKRYGQGSNVEFYIDMAKAWLDDKDAVGGGAAKAGAYWRYVVGHDN